MTQNPLLYILPLVVAIAAVFWYLRGRTPPPPVALVEKDDADALRERVVAQPELVHTRLPDGGLLLHLAAVNGAERSMRVLLGMGAQVDAPHLDGSTALTQAAAAGKLGAVNILLEAGAFPDAGDSLGVSPLHYASSFGHVEVVRRLLEVGACPDVKDASARSPLDIAESTDKADVVALLRGHGARHGAEFRMKDVLASWPRERRAKFRVPSAWSLPKDDPALLEGVARARANVKWLKDAAAEGRAALVKWSFRDGEAVESVWGEVVGHHLGGTLKVRVTTPGVTVRTSDRPIDLDPEEVEDWKVVYSDGRTYGGYTEKVTFDALLAEFGSLPKEIVGELATLIRPDEEPPTWVKDGRTRPRPAGEPRTGAVPTGEPRPGVVPPPEPRHPAAPADSRHLAPPGAEPPAQRHADGDPVTVPTGPRRPQAAGEDDHTDPRTR